jgi:hypothetical protein
MGLVLYALLILFGIRGMPVRRAAVFCVVTAAILTVVGVGGLSDLPGCSGVRCRPPVPTIAETFLITVVIAFACFGLGFATHRLMRHQKS